MGTFWAWVLWQKNRSHNTELPSESHSSTEECKTHYYRACAPSAWLDNQITEYSPITNYYRFWEVRWEACSLVTWVQWHHSLSSRTTQLWDSINTNMFEELGVVFLHQCINTGLYNKLVLYLWLCRSPTSLLLWFTLWEVSAWLQKCMIGCNEASYKVSAALTKCPLGR